MINISSLNYLMTVAGAMPEILNTAEFVIEPLLKLKKALKSLTRAIMGDYNNQLDEVLKISMFQC